MASARRIYLAAFPEGMPTTEHLKLEEVPVPAPAEGQVLLRVIYLSLDPYMRGRMSPVRSYASHINPGDTMVGGTVCEVMESRLEGFAPGDIVLAGAGWQTHALSDGTGLRKLDPARGPLSAALGVLGMPGFTAYAGLLEHGRPKAGETVVVSAASGAVGQVVGQMARILGCRAVGVAGAEDKCRYVTETLGFDAAVNYRDADFPEQLAAACPDGVDVYFENVGGAVFDAVLPLMNDFGRIPVCGRIAHYNDSAPPPGPDRLPAAMGLVLTRRLTFRGFLQFDHLDRWEDFMRDMGGWLAEGRVQYREEIVDGLENAVEAFQGLLTGRNRGKLVIRVGEDPAAR
ncbi:NADP-dependent oxidoreductase [Oceanicella sp. SM1341]|uniref:NADP-dependent oxidoreductase n=1 Tax=Oceanicella sp. SM1341 TaxID=1548889 RepID=UPI000E530EF4|nr:NADP-dependent oxidoreductase [Oceanicella sp. SM1341]